MNLNYYLIELKNSYLLVPIVVGIGLLIAYSYNKATREDDIDNNEYFKLSILIGVLTTLVMYIQNIKYTLSESIIQGEPPF